jgi:hypothetical protein
MHINKTAQKQADEIERERLRKVREKSEIEGREYLQKLAEHSDIMYKLECEDDEKELDRIRCCRCGEAPWSCMCSDPGAENY